MFRHYLIAAWRNLAANALQSTIAMGGLALGLAAAVLAGLMVRNQLNYNSFLPGHERLYVVGTDVELGGHPVRNFPYTPHAEAGKLANIPGIEAVARIGVDFDGHALRHGLIQGVEFINYADPNIFSLLQLPMLHGDLKSALTRPDTIVIPLSTARKYFGIDNAVGQTLTLDGKHLLQVAAVVADLPFNASNLRSAIFISGKSTWSDMAKADAKRDSATDLNIDSQTFVRPTPGASVKAIEARMRVLNNYLLPHPQSMKVSSKLIPLAGLHTIPDYAPGVLDRLAAFAAVAFVILVLSVINFVNLTTARATRRGVEVAARKAMGAGREDLMMQFLGEAVVQALVALLLALAAVEWLAPVVNPLLETGAALDYGHSGSVILALLAGTALVGIAAGFYPALVLSSFSPALVLKGGPLGPERTGLVRQGLVILQFFVLVMLVIGAGIFMMQYRFALTRTFERADRMLFVQVPKCDGKFKDAVAALPGVEATGCSDISLVKDVSVFAGVKLRAGGTVTLETVTAGPGLLEMFAQKPIAGRGLMASDGVGEDEPKAGDPPVHVVINESALRVLGIASPQAAIGHAMRWVGVPVLVIVIGVVRDFSTYALEKPVGPIAYIYRDEPSLSPLVTIKLSGQDHGPVLSAVAQNWNRLGGGGPFQRMFLNDLIAQQRLPLLYEGAALAVFAGIALLLGCLGLFGLSVSAAERRTKEIGVRKAMGARRRDILALLLWQFARPVLAANLIAWPIGWWAMSRWLNGFAYHVTLQAWLFPVVGAATLAIALLTVAGQAILVARQKPVLALRYE